jgi:peptide subunit release factor RF-3
MKKHSQRAQRIGDQIQRELADLFANEVKDPRVGRITLTQVEVAGDLAHATVYFTHLAGREHAAEAIALAQAACRPFDLASFREGHLTPVLFGSALRNFGVRDLIDQAIAEDKKHPQE